MSEVTWEEIIGELLKRTNSTQEAIDKMYEKLYGKKENEINPGKEGAPATQLQNYKKGVQCAGTTLWTSLPTTTRT